MTTYIAHPDLPNTAPVPVPDTAVPHYRAAGWETVPEPQPVPKLPAGPVAEGDSATATPDTDTDTEAPRRRRSTAKES